MSDSIFDLLSISKSLNDKSTNDFTALSDSSPKPKTEEF